MAHCILGLGTKAAIAHCNFHLRGEESDGDAEFVRLFAERAGVRFHIADFDTVKFARENAVSIEMAARELRYRWFDSLCKEHGYGGVCVAHNANDNAETLILNLLRGTGLRGICGMDSSSVNPYGSTKVLRPLLEWTRADIESYAAKHGLQWRTDSTNLECDCKRNIVRNGIFPLMAKINPSYIETLNKDIRNFRSGDSDLVRSMLEAGFNGSVIEDALSHVKSPDACGGKRFYSPTHVLITTSGGYDLRPLNHETEREISIERLPWTKGRPAKTERGETLLDADRLGSEPRLRPFMPGDYMYPIGLKGRKKVSDILKDLKYNVLDKKHAMVVEGKGSHVMAIVGERVDEKVKITDSTKNVYRIFMKQ